MSATKQSAPPNPNPVAESIQAAGNAYSQGVTASYMGKLALEDPIAYQKVRTMQFQQGMISLLIILVFVGILFYMSRTFTCSQNDDCNDGLSCVQSRCTDPKANKKEKEGEKIH